MPQIALRPFMPGQWSKPGPAVKSCSRRQPQPPIRCHDPTQVNEVLKDFVQSFVLGRFPASRTASDPMRSLLATAVFALLLGVVRTGGEAHLHHRQRLRRLRRRPLPCLRRDLRRGGCNRAVQGARVRAGGILPQGRPRRDHRRDPGQRPGLHAAASARNSSPSSARAKTLIRYRKSGSGHCAIVCMPQNRAGFAICLIIEFEAAST